MKLLLFQIVKKEALSRFLLFLPLFCPYPYFWSPWAPFPGIRFVSPASSTVAIRTWRRRCRECRWWRGRSRLSRRLSATDERFAEKKSCVIIFDKFKLVVVATVYVFLVRRIIELRRWWIYRMFHMRERSFLKMDIQGGPPGTGETVTRKNLKIWYCYCTKAIRGCLTKIFSG